MSNHDETVVKIFGLFVVFLSFWFVVSFVGVVLISLFDSSFFSVANIFYAFLGVLLIRVFYPRFVFRG